MIRILLILLLLPLGMQAQVKYLLPNEQTLFAFETFEGKKMVLAKDTADGYIVYRFGSYHKIELEYPEKNKDSWNKFTYSYYFRGGGIDNSGLDLNYVYFDNKGVRYVIYDNYVAENNESTVGVRVIEPDHTETDIQGIYRKRRGTLINFRYNTLLQTGNEMFD